MKALKSSIDPYAEILSAVDHKKSHSPASQVLLDGGVREYLFRAFSLTSGKRKSSLVTRVLQSSGELDYLMLVSALELLLADDECMSAFSFRPTIWC